MITKDFLKEKGFVVETERPTSGFIILRLRLDGGYVSVWFKESTPFCLFAYSESPDNNVRKVAISNSVITQHDLELAMAICNFQFRQQ